MMELVAANWWLIVIALVIGVVVAWWVFAANRKTRVVRETPRDVLEEGAAPARRNQALIDAPNGSPLAPPPPPAAEPQPAPAAPEPAAPAPVSVPEPAAPQPEPEPVPEPEPLATPEPVTIESEPEPQPEPAPAPTADDLTRIKGLGPKLEKLLQGLGIATYAQIAELTDADIDRIDPQLGNFAGRIRRDSFVEQARFLAAGDIAGFEARFGAL